MTEAADIVIVGGGIIGTASAYFLANSGARVVLYEKGEIAGEQSSRNWGFVRIAGRDPFEIPLAIESVRIWSGLEKELGADIEWRQQGGLAVAGDEKTVAGYERWLELARQYQLPAKLLSSKEIADAMPGVVGSWPGALYNATDGQAEPAKVAPAFAAAAERLGARIVTGCAVDAIERAGGSVTGVRTERGEVRAPIVICAAGAWASRLLATAGIAMPQLAVRGTVARTTPVRAITGAGVWAPELAFRQRRDGTLNIVDGAASDYDLVPATFRWGRHFLPMWRAFGNKYLNVSAGRPLVDGLVGLLPGTHNHPFRSTRVLDPPANPKRTSNALAAVARMFPDLGEVSVTRSWAGSIDMTPDMMPVIGAADDLSGLIIASGFSGHGFMMGPAAGKLVAELALTGKPSLNLEPFRLGRFFDGTSTGPRVVY